MESYRNYIYRIVVLSVILFSFHKPAHSQVTIGDIKPPETSSALQLETSDRGLRMNQLNSEQKTALERQLRSSNTELTKGLVIYDSDTQTLQYWDGDKWVRLTGFDQESTSGNYFQSQGEGKAGIWNPIKFPVYKKGNYYLYSTDVKKDLEGCVFGWSEVAYDQYDETHTMETWQPIEGLTVELDIPQVDYAYNDKPKNKVMVQFQTGIEIGATYVPEIVRIVSPNPPYIVEYDEAEIPSVSFSMGVFIGNGNDPANYKLHVVRTERIDATNQSSSMETYTVTGTIHDLPPGKQTLKMAFKRRNQINIPQPNPDTEAGRMDPKKSIAIGGVLNNTALFNRFMAQSYIKVNVYVLDP